MWGLFKSIFNWFQPVEPFTRDPEKVILIEPSSSLDEEMPMLELTGQPYPIIMAIPDPGVASVTVKEFRLEGMDHLFNTKEAIEECFKKLRETS